MTNDPGEPRPRRRRGNFGDQGQAPLIPEGDAAAADGATGADAAVPDGDEFGEIAPAGEAIETSASSDEPEASSDTGEAEAPYGTTPVVDSFDEPTSAGETPVAPSLLEPADEEPSDARTPEPQVSASGARELPPWIAARGSSAPGEREESAGPATDGFSASSPTAAADEFFDVASQAADESSPDEDLALEADVSAEFDTEAAPAPVDEAFGGDLVPVDHAVAGATDGIPDATAPSADDGEFATPVEAEPGATDDHAVREAVGVPDATAPSPDDGEFASPVEPEPGATGDDAAAEAAGVPDAATLTADDGEFGSPVEPELPAAEAEPAASDLVALDDEPDATVAEAEGDAPDAAELDTPEAVAAGSTAAQTAPSGRRRERRRDDLLELDLAGGTAVPRPATPAPPATGARPATPGARPAKGRRPGGQGRSVDFASVVVDRDDDLPTVFGKLDTAASPRVALVTHGGNREMEGSRLTLRRLKRYGESTGKDVVLVTRRWSLRAKARREGLRTAYMTRGIRWGRRRHVSLAIPGVGGIARALIGVGLILAVLVGVYLVIPGATVKIRPSIIAISKPVNANVTLRADVPDFELGELPAERLKVSLDYSVAIPVTGSAVKPTGRATGTVTFSNPTADTIEIPEGTRIKTAEAVVFVTTEAAEVIAGGEVDVPISALLEGDSGTVAEDTIKILEGDLVGNVTVTNPQATDPTGTESVPAVVEEDLANLRTVVIDVVSDRAMEALRADNPGDLIFEETLDVSIIDEQFSSDVGEEANWVTIDAELSITAIAASAEDLREMARFWLAEDLLEDEVLLDKTLSAEVASGSPVEYNEEDGTVNADILLQGGIVPTFDPTELKAQIAGSSEDDATAFLSEELPSLTEPTIDRGPTWLPGGLPRFEWRIKLIVEPGP